MLVLLFNPSRVGQALGQIRDPNARVSFSPLDPVMGRIAGEFGGMWEILTPTHTGLSLHEERKKNPEKLNSDRVCVITYYYGVVLSTLPLRTPSQQNTASAIQILLIALVPSCHNVSTPHGANSVY